MVKDEKAGEKIKTIHKSITAYKSGLSSEDVTKREVFLLISLGRYRK